MTKCPFCQGSAIVRPSAVIWCEVCRAGFTEHMAMTEEERQKRREKRVKENEQHD